jgi:hypothetical protein
MWKLRSCDMSRFSRSMELQTLGFDMLLRCVDIFFMNLSFAEISTN